MHIYAFGGFVPCSLVSDDPILQHGQHPAASPVRAVRMGKRGSQRRQAMDQDASLTKQLEATRVFFGAMQEEED